MASPQMSIRIAANVDELRKNLLEGKASIEALGPSVESLAKKWTGNSATVVQDARNITAAVDKIGGATNLTSKDASAALKKLELGMSQLKATGQTVPPSMEATAASLRSVTTATEASTKSTMSNVAAYAAGLATWEGVKKVWSVFTGFISSAIDEWAQAESAQVKLTAALRSQSMAIPSVINGYLGMASSLQQMTTFGDEAIMGVQSMMIQVGGVMPGMMEKATRATLDLAAGLGIDLNTAGLLVAKAMAGNTSTMSRYGIVLDEATLAAEGASYVLDTLNEKFGGQATAQIDTYAGRVKQLNNAWGDYKETIGAFLVNNPLVISALTNAAETSAEAAKYTGAVSTSFGDLVKASGSVLSPLGSVISLYERYVEVGNTVDTINRRLTAGRQDAAAGLGAYFDMQEMTNRGMEVAESVATRYADRVFKLTEVLVPLTAEQRTQIKTLLDLGDSVKEVADTLDLAERQVKKFQEAEKAAAKESEEFAKFLDKVTIASTKLASTLGTDLVAAAEKQTAAVVKGMLEQMTAINGVNAFYAEEQIVAIQTADVVVAQMQRQTQAAMTWSQAMDQVNAGKGTLGGTVVNAPNALNKQLTQQAWDAGNYYGPVVGGSQSNPRGTGPDWWALGYRAAGGAVDAMMPYMVGERGPELFVPNTSGRIVPGLPGVNVAPAPVNVQGGDTNISQTFNGQANAGDMLLAMYQLEALGVFGGAG